MMTNKERLMKLNNVYNLVTCVRLALKTSNEEVTDCTNTVLLSALNELYAVQKDLNEDEE